MAKVDLEVVKLILQRNEIDTRKVYEILEDINTEVEAREEEKEKEKTPPVKKQFTILVSDPQGDLEGKDLTGWVLQIPEEDSPATTEGRIFRAAYEYNVTPKGRRLPLQSVGEALENVSARLFKDQQLWVKTKEPVLVLTTSNKIPKASDEGGL
jgi:hypothetical protein